MVGFCLGLAGTTYQEQYRSILPERVREIMKQLINARSVLKEDPPMVPADAIKSVVSATLAKVNSPIGTLAWKERPESYENAIQAAIENLKTDKSIRFIGDGYLEGVIYLPYAEADRGLHCAHPADYGHFNGSIEHLANYVIKYTPESIGPSCNAQDMRALKKKWEAINADKSMLLDSLFSEKDEDLCDRLLSALRKRWQRDRQGVPSSMIEFTGFSAFVAVKCGYDFVWYELGWRYYTAARTTSEYVLEQNDVTFDENCGQVIFLP